VRVGLRGLVLGLAVLFYVGFIAWNVFTFPRRADRSRPFQSCWTSTGTIGN
jgi:hypothetical protein